MNTDKKFIKIRAVIELTGKSRASIYNGVKDGSFPAQINIGPHAVAWDSTEISKWQESRIMESKAARNAR
ncbi:prophage regulatory protein [Oxalobacteraceae bacterium GrIS 1.11]